MIARCRLDIGLCGQQLLHFLPMANDEIGSLKTQSVLRGRKVIDICKCDSEFLFFLK